ncbi:hypothetical protein [Streptomyces azureus]|uniref:hypothetical protein n=1 Tax=Streptomyces azureus TaxID=146537 RepID=UPI0007517D77|nr:hypothetical protein [Streptomyces azureus]
MAETCFGPVLKGRFIAVEDIDLIDLTNEVLNATRPEHRPAVTQAMDDMFGDVPAPEDTDS